MDDSGGLPLDRWGFVENQRENMKKSTRFVAVLLSCAAPALAASRAGAAMMSVTFSAPTYSDGVLNSGADTTTPGQDGWLNTSGGGTNNIAVSNSATNGVVSMTTSGQDVRRSFDGGAAITSGSVYFSADVNVSAAQATGDYALHLGDGSTSLFYARTYFKSSGTGYVMAVGTSSGTAVTYGTTVLPFNTVEHLLVRYDLVSGTANDTGALYVNPTTSDGSGDTPYVAATNIGTDATSISAFYLRQGSSTSAATLTVDNINVFATPEPASFGLLAVGGLGLLSRRRHSPRR